MRRLLSTLLIIVYGLFLVLMVLWWQQYYLTEAAGDWAFIFFIPYGLGGAFLMCFFIGRLCFFIKQNARVWEIFLYLLLLLLVVYIPEGLHEALMQSYSDGYSTLFKNWSAWLHPLIRRGGDTTRIILAESAIGFSLGSFLQVRRERKKQTEKKQNIEQGRK